MISLFASLAKPAAGGFTSIHPSLVLSSWAFSLARHSFSNSSSVRGGFNTRLRGSVGISRMAFIFSLFYASAGRGVDSARCGPRWGARPAAAWVFSSAGRNIGTILRGSGHPLTSLLPDFPFCIIVRNCLEVLDKGWRLHARDLPEQKSLMTNTNNLQLSPRLAA